MHGLWRIAHWILNYFDLIKQCFTRSMSWGQLKDNIWYNICFLFQIWLYDAQFMRYNLESYETLIWPLKVIQGKISWCKLIVHQWLPICVSNNFGHKVLGLWNITRWKLMTLICPFNIIIGNFCWVNWKAYDLPYVLHTNFDHVKQHLWDTCTTP